MIGKEFCTLLKIDYAEIVILNWLDQRKILKY